MCSVRPSQVVSTHQGLGVGLDAGPLPHGHYPAAIARLAFPGDPYLAGFAPRPLTLPITSHHYQQVVTGHCYLAAIVCHSSVTH